MVGSKEKNNGGIETASISVLNDVMIIHKIGKNMIKENNHAIKVMLIFLFIFIVNFFQSF